MTAKFLDEEVIIIKQSWQAASFETKSCDTQDTVQDYTVPVRDTVHTNAYPTQNTVQDCISSAYKIQYKIVHHLHTWYSTRLYIICTQDTVQLNCYPRYSTRLYIICTQDTVQDCTSSAHKIQYNWIVIQYTVQDLHTRYSTTELLTQDTVQDWKTLSTEMSVQILYTCVGCIFFCM